MNRKPCIWWGALALAFVVLPALVTTSAVPAEDGEGELWVDKLQIEWFLKRWRSGGRLATALAATETPQARLDALDAHFCSIPPVAGLPRGYMSHRGSLRGFRSHGELHFRHYPALSWRPPFGWGRPAPQRDATFFAELHSWRYLTELLAAYRNEGEQELLSAVEQLVEDWVRKNPYPDGAHPRAWHEGAVGKRTLVLIDWLGALAIRRPRERTRFRPYQVAALLTQHVEHLLLPETYTGLGNHGVRQDLALILASFALPEARLGGSARNPSVGNWREMVIQRLVNRQIAKGFSAEGVWREHSPAYHLYVIRLFNMIHRALVENHAGVPTQLKDLLTASERYLTHVLTPRGRFPPVGDSYEHTFPADETRSDGLRFSASAGRYGTPPADVIGEATGAMDAVFPAAGEAILRDRWGVDHDDQVRRFYLHLHAAQHLPMGHRHQDDLSFIVHHDGRWWLVEGGKYAYRQDEVRQHIVGAEAHNGPVLTGRTLEPTSRPQLDAWIEEASTHTAEAAAVRAVSERFVGRLGFPPPRAERIVVLLRKRPAVVVVDRLIANGYTYASWQTPLHLAPDLNVHSSGDASFEAYGPGSDLRLSLLFASPASLGEVGLLAPSDHRTWVSPARESVVSAPTLSVTHRAGRVVAPMLLSWQDGDEAPARQLWIEEHRNEQDEETATVGWSEGDERLQVTVAFTGPPLRAVSVGPASSAGSAMSGSL